jgi:CBS domain-containing protein
MYIVGFDAKTVMWKPITLNPKNTLLDARNTMMKYVISRVVIAEGKKPVGIITEKDIARFMYSEVPARQLDEIRVDEVMSRALITVEPDTDVRDCAKVMLQKQVSSLIVVDQGTKNLKGILTKTDLTTAFVEHFAFEHRVEDFMTSKVVTVSPDEPIQSAIMLMMSNEISRVVVAKDERLVGIIASSDLLPLGIFFSGQDYYKIKGRAGTKVRERAFIPSGIKALMLASDVMTKDPITTTRKSDLADAGYVMLRNKISGLPVINRQKILQGIVTKTDIVKALASHR